MSSTQSISAQSINEQLETLAGKNSAEFRECFRRLRKMFPEQATEAWLGYVAAHGMDAAAQSMNFWLLGDQLYISVLLDPDALSPEAAAKAIEVVKSIDSQFLFKFRAALGELKNPKAIQRALGLLPVLGECSILIPWLRTLTQHSDDRVRARSAKVLCGLRPNKGIVDRQMQSTDPRVRANAIEALWNIKGDDARQTFRAGVNDRHHRVVANALVGLHLAGDEEAVNQMIALCGHEEALFRAAMAWALGYVKDLRALPTLHKLTSDPVQMVRKRALGSLLILEGLSAKETPGPTREEQP